MWFNRFTLAVAGISALPGCSAPQPVVNAPYTATALQWAAVNPPNAQSSWYSADGPAQASVPHHNETIGDLAAQREATDRATKVARIRNQAPPRMLDQEEREAAQFRPKCSTVRVSGIAAGTAQDFDALQRSANRKDLVARYPLHCQPSGMTQTYACRGGAWLGGQSGHVIAWSDTGYQIATPVDLIGGQKDALVFVRRSDAVCLDNTPPSLDFTANLESFLKNHNMYR